MIRQFMGPILLLGALATAMALLFWQGSGLIHSGPIALIGAGLLAAALMKHARVPGR